MPASSTDESPSILDSMLMAAKKLPGQTVGGGIDLMNMVLGGGANIVQAIQGKEITRSIGEGLVPKPVGGSEQLNDLFGIPNTSSGLVEDSTGAILNALSPAGAVKSAVVGGKAMIIAAATAVSDKTLVKATTALKKGTDPAQVFKYTGVYEGPIDKKLRTVIDDSTSQINPDVISSSTPIANSRVYFDSNQKTVQLDDLLGHPELFDYYPELKDVAVTRGNLPPGNAAAYNSPAGSRIELGPMSSIKELHSVLLHEVQHIVQYTEGFTAGSSHTAFLPSKDFYDSFTKVQNTARELRNGLAKKYGILPDDVASMADNPAMKGSSILTDPDYKLYMQTRRAQAVGMEVENIAKMKYIHTAGEAEARATQTQFGLANKARERGEEPGIFFPLEIYDVPPSALVSSPYDSKLKAKP